MHLQGILKHAWCGIERIFYDEHDVKNEWVKDTYIWRQQDKSNSDLCCYLPHLWRKQEGLSPFHCGYLLLFYTAVQPVLFLLLIRHGGVFETRLVTASITGWECCNFRLSGSSKLPTAVHKFTNGVEGLATQETWYGISAEMAPLGNFRYLHTVIR